VDTEIDARRARRVVWAFRLLAYGGAAIAAALLLTGGGDEGTTFLDGRTSQDEPFTMELEDGRPTHLGVALLHSCGWRVRWWSFDGKTTRFRFDDGRLVVRERITRDYGNGEVGERNYSLEARIADGRVTGTMRVVENVTAGRGTYVCESGDVSFSAG
jgi:hypothetical protein